MAEVLRQSPYVRALDEDDGAVIEPADDGYVTLTVDTFFFALGVANQPLESIHIQTGSAIAGVFAIETCNNLRNDGIASVAPPGTITDWDDSASSPWVKEDPTTAYVATNGTGWSVTNLTLTKTAGVGNAMIHLGNLGARRCRLRADITTGGTVRVAVHGKS